ncbi:MAG TPA: response regulator [Polyangia bacterium]|nr:response regulator [Polyangia bacterium]
MILLADPDPATRGVLRTILEEAGYSVTAVATGLEAAQVLMQTVPRLIVLDLDLKWLSGRQLIGVLRHNRHTSLIPLVALGGSDEDLGGIPILLRPVAADQLLALVHRLVPSAAQRHSYL